jgi:hypothetical protein
LLICIHAPLRAIARDFEHGDIENRLNAEVCRVVFQIFNDLRSRRIGRVRARHRHSGQAGMAAIGVQMKTIIMASPDRADRICFFQHRGAKSQCTHARCARQARRAGTDNNCINITHGVLEVRNAFANGENLSGRRKNGNQ